MDIDLLTVNQIINSINVIGGVGVLLFTQLLKSKLMFFVPFERYPVPTTLGVSAVITFIALQMQEFVWALENWEQILITFVTVAGVGAFLYNHIIKHWPAVRATEGSRV